MIAVSRLGMWVKGNVCHLQHASYDPYTKIHRHGKRLNIKIFMVLMSIVLKVVGNGCFV